ncbi:Hypothetical predicted protein [Olea europaea subsp. europaea]|uniref:Uncharacterized protein n=1 Tax=Olea europaea subsp. europaea TaxID=158383 RepID=A0A8S0TLX3_OLEEU|nr:Hypothetical predicted protein [Olea europaea subsp. europaea]
MNETRAALRSGRVIAGEQSPKFSCCNPRALARVSLDCAQWAKSYKVSRAVWCSSRALISSRGLESRAYKRSAPIGGPLRD